MNKQKCSTDVNDYLKDMICCISEEWGEAVKAMNNYRFGKGDMTLTEAYVEVTHITPLILELFNYLRVNKGE